MAAAPPETDATEELGTFSEANQKIFADLESIGVGEAPRQPDLITAVEGDRWVCPKLDGHGWHPLSGTKEERDNALKAFNIDLSCVQVEDMRRWYQGTSRIRAAYQSVELNFTIPSFLCLIHLKGNRHGMLPKHASGSFGG